MEWSCGPSTFAQPQESDSPTINSPTSSAATPSPGTRQMKLRYPTLHKRCVKMYKILGFGLNGNCPTRLNSTSNVQANESSTRVAYPLTKPNPTQWIFKFWSNPTTSKRSHNIGVRSVVYVIKKAEKKWWDRLIKQEGKSPAFVKVDWDKWVDEEEENGRYCVLSVHISLLTSWESQIINL